MYKLKDHISYEEATLTEPLSCMLTGINQINLLPNFTTVIIGAGPIGILYSYALASKGVTGCLVDISEERLAIADSIAPERWSAHATLESAIHKLAPLKIRWT